MIKESIRDAISIFKLFNFNATCNRWAQHLIYMMEALNRPPAIIPSSLQQTTKTSTTTTTPVLSTHPITSTNLNYQQQQQQQHHHHHQEVVTLNFHFKTKTIVVLQHHRLVQKLIDLMMN